MNPALTPEEWAGPFPVERHDWLAGVKSRGDGSLRLYLAVKWTPMDEADSLHALAALALHGQPFGFTWEDVDWLESLEGCGLHVVSLRDRIAALLPPREEG